MLTATQFQELMDSPPATREQNREAWEAVSEISEADIIAVDTETNGENIIDGRGFLMGISVGWKTGDTIKGYYFPFRHQNGGNLDKQVLGFLKTVIEKAKARIFHNAKFDIESLATININVEGLYFFDTMLMCHLINENRPFAKSLDGCADWYLEGGIKSAIRGADLERKRAKRKGDVVTEAIMANRISVLQEQAGTFKKLISEDFKKWIEVFGWASIPASLMAPYATQDAVLTFQLFEKIFPLFQGENLIDYWNYKQQFVEVIRQMEKAGVRVDTDLSERESLKGEARMEAIKKELGGYNPGSTDDLKILLIDQLHLPVLKQTPGGKPSFDKTVMPEYDEMLEAMDNPLAHLVLEFRGWQKTVSSNYRAYLNLLSPDGRLRCNYKLHGTKTGRLSCEKPNLQQIPKQSDKEWNGHLKEAFIAEDGFSLWEADYSQLELRLTACYSKEQSLIDTFNEDRDIFDEMSERLGMVRQDCKTFVYSTQYGAGVRRIKTALGITTAKAQQIRENYHTTYPRIKHLSEATASRVRQTGRLKLWTGRVRHFFEPEKEAHKAMNSLMQGGGADVVERQMIRLYNEIVVSSNGECRMLLQVHDSVVFEIKNGCEDKYLPEIRRIMEDMETIMGEAPPAKFKVDIHRWGLAA